MEKVKVNLLVKGNIIVAGAAMSDSEKADFYAFDNKPIPDKYDLSETAVIDGDMVVEGNIVLVAGVIAAMGEIVNMARQDETQSIRIF